MERLAETFIPTGIASTLDGNPLLASVWEAKAAGPFSLMHSGYGMGAAIAPLLIKPFTLPSVPKNDTTITSDTPTGINATNNNTAKDLVLVDAVVPYSIISGIIFSCVAYFLCIICIDQPTFILTTKRDKEKVTHFLAVVIFCGLKNLLIFCRCISIRNH
ncbi:unnamed protein product [Trichobilharzia regenti]|nr:unnamed protein product [Trichobilharzia regenti]